MVCNVFIKILKKHLGEFTSNPSLSFLKGELDKGVPLCFKVGKERYTISKVDKGTDVTEKYA